jgi:hypothetical protein
VELIRVKGQGCHCFKRDLKRAYRQIPCCPGDWHLVGFSGKNHIFFDRVLSMGLRSAAYICQRVTNAVSYICDFHYGLQVINYLDDFAGCNTPDKTSREYDTLGQVLKECGLEESVENAIPPSTSMFCLGILVDTVSCTLSITKERLDEISSLVEDCLIRSKCTLKELQSLLGKLHFVSTCVRPGRVFVSRLLTWLKTFGGQNVSKKIPKYVKLDLVWWSTFLIIYNGVSMMFLQDISTPDCILSYDSTLVGCAGLCGDLYFHKIFPRFIQKKRLHINALELRCLVVSLKLEFGLTGFKG